METHELYGVVAVGLFCIGLAAVFLCRHLLKKIIATKIIGAGAFLMLISIAERDAEIIADPVPHAMVITGIVVAVSAAAFALALARQIRMKSGQSEFGGEPK